MPAPPSPNRPKAPQFKWRATNEWQRGTHSRSTVEASSVWVSEQSHRATFSFESDHPEVFASEDHGATPAEHLLVALAGCLTAGVAAVAQNREIQLRSVKATVEGDMDILGILGGDPEVRNGFEGIRVHYEIDADASPCRYRGAGGPVPEAVGCLRRRHQPDQHHRRGELSRARMRTTTVVIGAGHAGLAVSHFLTRRSIDHVVIERGEVAHSWRTERWDSLRLLTPNWQSRLPGFAYAGDDPDGFMTMPEVIGFIDRYADQVARRSTPTPPSPRCDVATTATRWSPTTGHGRARQWSSPPAVSTSPRCRNWRRRCPASVEMVTPLQYRGLTGWRREGCSWWGRRPPGPDRRRGAPLGPAGHAGGG
jgi:uncharacterized OsmC-like protein